MGDTTQDWLQEDVKLFFEITDTNRKKALIMRTLLVDCKHSSLENNVCTVVKNNYEIL